MPCSATRIASALRQQNSPDAHILASSSDDQTVKLWDWSTGHASEPCRDMLDMFGAFSPQGKP